MKLYPPRTVSNFHWFGKPVRQTHVIATSGVPLYKVPNNAYGKLFLHDGTHYDGTNVEEIPVPTPIKSYPSKTNPTKDYTIWEANDGTLYCDCWQWKRGKNCAHLRDYIINGTSALPLCGRWVYRDDSRIKCILELGHSGFCSEYIVYAYSAASYVLDDDVMFQLNAKVEELERRNAELEERNADLERRLLMFSV